MELLKLLSTNEIFAQVVSFLLLLFFLRVFAWKRVLNLLDQRRQRIASEFKGIEESRAEIEKLKAAYDEKFRLVEDEAKLRIQKAVLEGQAEAGQIKAIAEKEAQKIIDSAKNNIKYEILKARQDLRDEIVDLVIDATEEVLVERVTDKEDRKIVEDFIAKVDKAK